MQVDEYLNLIESGWPEKDHPPADELLRLAEKAISAHPTSPKIICVRADLLQLRAIFSAGSEAASLLDQAGDAYKASIAIDSSYAAAHEALGFMMFTFGNNPGEAENYFRSAIALGAGTDSYVGLAKLLAEQGQKHAALHVLESCPDDISVVRTRTEIEHGDWDPV